MKEKLQSWSAPYWPSTGPLPLAGLVATPLDVTSVVANEQIFMVSQGNRAVGEYNVEGTDLGAFAIDGGGTPSFLTVNPVSIPEPRRASMIVPLAILNCRRKAAPSPCAGAARR